MTPQQKAYHLIERFIPQIICKIDQEEVFNKAKEYTLIAVDEIIDSSQRYPSNVDWDDCGATHQYYYEEQREEALKFWKEVKQEIEKL